MRTAAGTITPGTNSPSPASRHSVSAPRAPLRRLRSPPTTDGGAPCRSNSAVGSMVRAMPVNDASNSGQVTMYGPRAGSLTNTPLGE